MATAVAVPPAPTSPVDLSHDADAPKGKGKAIPPIAQVVAGQECVLEPKYDGWRILAHITEDGVRLYTRNATDHSGKLLKIEAELAQLPVGTWLDCEAVSLQLEGTVVVDDWNSVQKCLGSGIEKARMRAEGITLVAFDLIAFNGIDARSTSFRRRRSLLEGIFEKFDFDRIMLTPQTEPTDEALAAFIAQGFEGGVVKTLDSPYASGQRGAGWTKMKPQETRDFVVTGYKPGENGFTGMVGAIEFGAYDEDGKLVEVGRCSGMDMATRIKITNNQADYIGTVIEVKHMGFMNEGYRHPQFKKFRPDKPAKACKV